MNRDYFHRIGILPREKGLWRAYVLGFVLSILCTAAAFLLVMYRALSPAALLPALALLALVQCAIQGIFFLHLAWDNGSKPKLLVLSFAVLVVSILVGGSLWIMWSLGSRMTLTGDQMQEYMQAQGGF